jgi:hypothetical protein
MNFSSPVLLIATDFLIGMHPFPVLKGSSSLHFRLDPYLEHPFSDFVGRCGKENFRSSSPFYFKTRLFGLKLLLSGRYAQQDLASLLKKIGKNAVFWYAIPTGKGAEPQTTLIIA